MLQLNSLIRLAMTEFLSGWEHFRGFLACLVLGVVVMATVNMSGGMIKHAFEEQAQSLLGGDVEVRSSLGELSEDQLAFLRSYGTISHVSKLRSMLYSENYQTLVDLKAVDNHYPLIGEVELYEDLSIQDALKDRGVVVDKVLLAQLGLSLGDNIMLGKSLFTIRGTLKVEPDRAVQLFTFGPRVLLSHASLEATQLVSALSLIRHQYRIVLYQEAGDIGRFERALEATLQVKFPDVTWHVVTTTDGNSRVDRFVNQLISFLSLSALATFLISGIGIGSSVRSFLEKKITTIAILKILGASSRYIFMAYSVLLIMICMVGGLLGITISICIILVGLPFVIDIIPALRGHNNFQLMPFLLSMWYALLITFIFSMPALISALGTRAAQLFRMRTGLFSIKVRMPTFLVIGVLVCCLVLTLLFTAYDRFFLAVALTILLGSFLLFHLCALLIRFLAQKCVTKTPWFRLALGNLYRPGNSTGTVIYAVGISLTVLIALTVSEANFQSRIEEIVEEKAPSLFMFDIHPHQRGPLAELMERYATADSLNQQPMVRGRITHINGKIVTEDDVDEDVRWALLRDRGLSYRSLPPPETVLTQGAWWSESYRGDPRVSVDHRFMKGMGLKLGDTLTFDILGDAVSAKVASAREIDYSSFQINFALIFSPGVLESYPHTYLMTVHLDHAKDIEAEILRALGKDFPGVTVIRTREIVDMIQRIMGNIAIALRITVVISLIAGIVVLVSSLGATLEQRLYDVAILKIMGARKTDILKSCLVEWGIISVATSILASVIGTWGAWLIVMRLRGKVFDVMPHVTLVTVILCFSVVVLTGRIGNAQLFNIRPANLLRNE